ncbi:MAG TPA: hypothetical protein VGF56_13020 [Rhizomicrobium sp.]|jgi:hypothetical protein
MSARGGDTVRQRSGWLIPAAVFIVTAALSALILLYYLAPTASSIIEEHPQPTSRTDPIALQVEKLKLTIPANYILYASARQGGQKKEVALAAKLPDFHGYSDWYGSTFSDNSSDSPIIYLLIREDPLTISEADKLKRIYLSYVADPVGKPGPFGLTQYAFRDDSGYHGEDLYVGQTPKGPVVLRCVRFGPQVTSPSCLRDMRLGHHVALTYRFKRAHLGEWQDIATGIDSLVGSFTAQPKR